MRKNNMKKVGILTFTYGDNYGQRLQNLAVQELIKLYRYDVYTIPQVLPKNYKIDNKNRHKFFVEFDRKYIKYYDLPIGRHTRPKGLRSFDFFVAGSDQIWSPYSCDVNPSFFLRFAPKKKRIALAPSIAATEIPLKKKLLYKLYLNGFDKLSVREDESSKIVQRYTSKQVKTLIDPTLMFDIDFWGKYEKPTKYSIPQKYFLLYSLGNSIDDKEIENIAKQKGCEVVFLKKGHEEFEVGPSEFLYLVRNAMAIVTDSYHGTIFSILYRKPFYHIVREKGIVDMSSRFDTLFSKLSISLSNESEMEEVKINYNDVLDRLNIERNAVKKYINQYLSSDMK